MTMCILTAFIMVLLRIDSCAGERSNQNNMITTYDPGDITSETPISPRLPNYGQISANDQPNHHPENHGQIRFEDQPSRKQIKFEDDPKDQFLNIDKLDTNSENGHVKFEDDGNSDENDRILKVESKYDSKNAGNNFTFEGNIDQNDNSHDKQSNDDPEKDLSQAVFDADTKSDDDEDDEYSDSETDEDSTEKSIKFENEAQEPNPALITADFERNTVTERVAFIDDSNNQEPGRKKTRKTRRKPRLQTLQENQGLAPNSPYPGYSSYSGVGYPGPGYPGLGDPTAGYPGYPIPPYPTGYPYTPYPSPYPSMAYLTPGYPGYSPYPLYPTMTPGYGAYPPSAYQGPEDQRPMPNPVYPTPGQVDPSGHAVSKYPYQDDVGPSSQGPIPSGHLGAMRSEYGLYQGYSPPGYPQGYPADLNYQYPLPNQGQYRPGYPGQGYPNRQQRPSRRPKSLTQRAVSAVAEALTSIALYDDLQCVPKMLCEVAGGSTATSSTLLKATASLQPLLTTLQSYNTISSSPLFIFGRAAVTGMTAKGNPSACRHAYPQCPNDPEKLINYLNNHNGGFFRFFGQPDVSQKPQNLEQFYSYLSGQYGLQQPQQNYGFPQQYGYGLQANPYPQPQNYRPNYYPEQNSYRNAKNIESEIEERIQNKPGVNALEDDNDPGAGNDQDKGSKWLFPDETSAKKRNDRDPPKLKKQPVKLGKVSKTLKFPDDRSDDKREIHRVRDYPRRDKHIFFPGESNFYIKLNYETSTPVNPEEYVFDHKHKFYVKKSKTVKNEDVVYIVRGNGDPNHPEIVKLRSGQSL